MRNDFELLDRLIADDFIAIGTRGEQVGDKASLFSLMKAGRIRVRYNKDVKLRVTVEGDSRAVITGEAISGQELDGHFARLRFKFSDVFERRNGQWKNVRTRVIRFLPTVTNLVTYSQTEGVRRPDLTFCSEKAIVAAHYDYHRR